MERVLYTVLPLTCLDVRSPTSILGVRLINRNVTLLKVY